MRKYSPIDHARLTSVKLLACRQKQLLARLKMNDLIDKQK